jgi:quinol monooxygenase YgiN
MMQVVQPFGIANDSLEPQVELTIVTMTFDATEPTALAGVLANYVVTSRGEPGCRNIDLCVAVQDSGRFVVIEKWESPAHQRAHFDGEAMVTMARSCAGIIASAPAIELLEGISAHDLH